MFWRTIESVEWAEKGQAGLSLASSRWGSRQLKRWAGPSVPQLWWAKDSVQGLLWSNHMTGHSNCSTWWFSPTSCLGHWRFYNHMEVFFRESLGRKTGAFFAIAVPQGIYSTSFPGSHKVNGRCPSYSQGSKVSPLGSDMPGLAAGLAMVQHADLGPLA